MGGSTARPDNPFRVVLVHPEIPQNTGNIGRLTAAAYAELHLIEPLGFDLSEKQVRRAGLDYWPEVRVSLHPTWDAFLSATSADRESLWLFTKLAQQERSYFDVQFAPGSYLVFGSETKGLPEVLHQRYPERRVGIPLSNPNVRSLNLANAASVALFEALRQNRTG